MIIVSVSMSVRNDGCSMSDYGSMVDDWSRMDNWGVMNYRSGMDCMSFLLDDGVETMDLVGCVFDSSDGAVRLS